jgi:hypothetical protein
MNHDNKWKNSKTHTPALPTDRPPVDPLGLEPALQPPRSEQIENEKYE